VPAHRGDAVARREALVALDFAEQLEGGRRTAEHRQRPHG
jgi:hypothetical protein